MRVGDAADLDRWLTPAVPRLGATFLTRILVPVATFPCITRSQSEPPGIAKRCGAQGDIVLWRTTFYQGIPGGKSGNPPVCRANRHSKEPLALPRRVASPGVVKPRRAPRGALFFWYRDTEIAFSMLRLWLPCLWKWSRAWEQLLEASNRRRGAVVSSFWHSLESEARHTGPPLVILPRNTPTRLA